MSKKSIDSGATRNKWVLSLIPVVVIVIGMTVLNLSTKPDVKFIPEVVKPGYETTPAAYSVTASYSKIWHDTNKPFLIVLAFVIGGLGTFAYIHYVQSQLRNGNRRWFFIFWLIALLFAFGPTVLMIGDALYNSTLSVPEYEHYKDNLDSIFPQTEQ